jgi:hypothetical protein
MISIGADELRNVLRPTVYAASDRTMRSASPGAATSRVDADRGSFSVPQADAQRSARNGQRDDHRVSDGAIR